MKRYQWVAALFFALGVSVATAADGVSVTLDMFQQKTVTGVNGDVQTVLQPLDRMVPDSVVVYVITYTNNGNEPASDITLHDPIPQQLIYIAGSAEGEGTDIAYSVDGGANWAANVSKLKVKGEDGQLRVATDADVNTLRWVVKQPVAPGQSGKVTFAAKIK